MIVLTPDAAAIACDDDHFACGGNIHALRVVFADQASQPYDPRAGGYLNSAYGMVGDGVLNVSLTPACPCDWNLNGVPSVQDIVDFLACSFSGCQ